MQKADLFILLDHVQFEQQNYQNRVLIKTGEGPRWIIVPLYHVSQDQRIIDKVINNQRDGRLRWGRKVYLTLQYAYQGAPFFNKYAPALREVFDTPWEKLIDINLKLLDMLRDALDIRTPMVRSSDLKVSGQRSDLVLNLCRTVSADTFLGGMGGSRGYLETETFQKAGIQVAWQDFVHPEYMQHPHPEAFVPGLSALDLLFNCGPESGDILKGRALAYAGKA